MANLKAVVVILAASQASELNRAIRMQVQADAVSLTKKTYKEEVSEYLSELRRARWKYALSRSLMTASPSSTDLARKVRVAENDLRYHLRYAKYLGLKCEVEVLLAKAEFTLVKRKKE